VTAQEILQEIETEPLPRVLFVHGPETVWHDRIFTALKHRNSKDSLAEFNWSVFYGSKDMDLEPLLLELGMVPWGDGPKIVVLKNGESVPAAIMEHLASWLEQNLKTNCFALFVDKVDQRLKYVKILRQFALEVECEALQGDALLRHVVDLCTREGKKMKRETAELFLNRVGHDLLMIQNELEKLFAFSEGQEEITCFDVQSISSLSPAQIVNHTVFQMTDFIVQKRRQEALGVLNVLLAAGEPALRILPLIERQLRLVLAAKTAETNLDDVAKQMGETNSYALRKVQKHAKKYDLQEIFSGFQEVLHADRELKLGVPGDQVLSDLIVKLT
jgi:DNA polymerase-3 subunit delta